jgi:hypothetical protein
MARRQWHARAGGHGEIRRCAALGATLVLFASVSCGYSATPIELFIEAEVADGDELRVLDLRGISDPAASAFNDGLMLSTRWSISREGVRVAELFIDINRRALPQRIPPLGEPVELPAEDQSIELILRGGEGQVLARLEPSASSTIFTRIVGDSGRELSAGSFVYELPSLYDSLSGFWQTVPPPPRATPLPTDTSYPPSDPGGDPADPGPDESDPDAGDGADDDEEYVFDSGCSCPGGETDEDLPDEEPDEDEDVMDTGGCDCTGDDTGDEESEEDDKQGGCAGDDTGGEEIESEENEENDDDTKGCDCQGDSDPEEASEASMTAAGAGDRAIPKKPHRRRCRHSSTRIAFEMSPAVLAFWVSRRRRKLGRGDH